MNADCGPRITVTAVNRPYVEGLVAGELRLQYCPACARHQFYPRPLCTACGSPALEWRKASGRGRVHSLTQLAMAPSAPFKPLVPYGLALVDLDEGPRMMGHVTQADDLVIGARVAFAGRSLIEGVDPVPVFVGEDAEDA